MAKLFILDGNALLHRAYHAIQPLTDSRGRVVNAVYGFARVLAKIIKDFKPDYIAVCWDRKEKTLRHEAYVEYKATREAKPQDLYDQIPMIQDLLRAYGIPSYDRVGYEADDLIATIAKKLEKKADEVIIVTGDMDTLQIVNDKISVLAFKKGVSETEKYDPKKVEERYGLPPERLIDYKALVGDVSDNIKGVKGIGPKGAQNLIEEYGSIDEVYRALESGGLHASEKIKNCLTAGKKSAIQSRALVSLVLEAPIEFSLEEMKFGGYNPETVRKFYVEYGFRSLAEKMESGIADREPGEIKEIINFGEAKKIIGRINNELLFYIVEAQESLFGKEIKEICLASNGEMAKIVFGKNLKAQDFFREAKPIFEDEKIKKAGYDLKSQMHILSGFGVGLAGVYFDIMLAGYALNPGVRRYAIEELNSDFLKKTQSNDLILDLVNLKILLAKKIEEEKLQKVFYEIEMPLLPVLYNMEKAGILVDKNVLGELSAKFADRLVKIDKEIYKMADGEFNIDSPQQLKVVLYDKLGLKPASGRIKKGKTGLSTAASELEKLAGMHPIIDLISEHRELAKLKNTYVDTLPKQADKADRVHSTFNQTITSTGRLSSSGPNLQNIPNKTELGREIRKAFVAPKGFLLVSLDYSQIELRLAAALTGEKHMIDAFLRGEDIHRQTAAEIFGIDQKDVTKDMRQKAKTINFGVLYGMGAAGLAAGAKMPRQEAEDFLARYYAAHPAIMEYVERTKALAYKTGYVETLFGRRRYVPEIKSFIPQVQAAAERMAVNMPIQGTAADIIKMAMIEIDKNIINSDVRMVLQVHDELVFEIKKDKEAKAVAEIKEIMENIYKLKVPLEVEVEIGERWK